jgi:hypothetical protein
VYERHSGNVVERHASRAIAAQEPLAACWSRPFVRCRPVRSFASYNRIARENTRLSNRLPEALGEQAWRESGLGAPDDINTLQRRVAVN